MITRRPLRILVFALPLLLVLFAALLGTGALFRALEDAAAARALSIAAVVAGVLLFVDLVLLVGTLGLRAVLVDERRSLRGQRRQHRATEHSDKSFPE